MSPGWKLAYDREQSAWLVDAVWPGSPAESAGIQKGDQVLAVNGTDFPAVLLTAEQCKANDQALPEVVREVRASLDSIQPGSLTTAVIQRDGERLEFELMLEPRDVLLERAAVALGGMERVPVCYSCATCQQVGYPNGWTCCTPSSCCTFCL